jgi:hypothetical protein
MEHHVQIAARVPKSLYDAIIRRQKRAKKQSGYEPSISDVIRTLLEEATKRDR